MVGSSGVVRTVLVAAALLLASFVALAGHAGPGVVDVDAGGAIVADPRQPVTLGAAVYQGVEPIDFRWFPHDGPSPMATRLAGRVVTHVFEQPGVYDVTLVARDAKGAVDLDVATVTVHNEPPTIVAGVPTEVGEDQLVGFDARATRDTPFDMPSLQYAWDFGDGSNATGAVAAHAFERSGTYPVTLTVTDDDGAFDRRTWPVSVANRAPVAAASASPAEALEDETVTFDASAFSDTPHDDPLLLFFWDFGDGSSAAGDVARHAYTRQGTYLATVTVTDDNGASSTASVTVVVRNAVPIAVVEAPAAVLEGSSFVLDAGGSVDTPGDWPLLTYAWDMDGDGATDDLGWRAQARADDDGLLTTSVTVTDDDGAHGGASGSVLVTNVPPTPAVVDLRAAAITSVDLTMRAAGEKWHDVTLTLEEDGLFAGALTLVRTPGSPDDQSATLGDLVFASGVPREAVVRYTPEDDPPNGQPQGATPVWLLLALEDGRTEAFAHTFNVEHPEGWEWRVDLSAVAKVDVAGEMFDPGSDALTLAWSFGDGSPDVVSAYPTEPGPRTVFESVTHVYVRYGPHALVLTATDDDGGSGSAVTSVLHGPDFLKLANRAPAAAIREGDGTVEEEPVWLRVEAEDPDGDPLEVRWTFDDGSTGGGAEILHAWRDSGRYLVTARVGDGGMERVVTTWVEVTNLPPSAKVVAGSEHPAEDEEVAFDASASEDTETDRASLRYAWTFGTGGRASDLRPAHAFERSGTVLVTLRVVDNDGEVAVASAAVSVANVPPRRPVLVAPITAAEDQPIRFEAAAIDGDVDRALLSYAWDFGDGTAGSGARPVHAYASAGVYAVALTVIDPEGAFVRREEGLEVLDARPILWGSASAVVYGRSAEVTLEGGAYDTPTDAAGLTSTWEVFREGHAIVSSAGPSIRFLVDEHGTYAAVLSVGGVDAAQTAVRSVTFLRDDDGDGLLDVEEATYGTDAARWDTDGDRLVDAFEWYRIDGWLCMQRGGSREECFTHPLLTDTDGDGLSDGEELYLGEDHHLTLPAVDDTDGDGLLDGEEFYLRGANPTAEDSDGDGVWDVDDRMAQGVVALDWQSWHAPGLVKFTQRYDAFGLVGHHATVHTKDDNGCHLRDQTAEATRSSNVQPGSVVDSVNAQLGRAGQRNYTAAASHYVSHLQTSVVDFREGQPVEGCADAKYEIVYHVEDDAYDVDFVNSADVLIEDEGGQAFTYLTGRLPVELSRDQSYVFQFAVQPEGDRSDDAGTVRPAFLYHVFASEDPTHSEPFRSGLAIPRPLGDHAYEAAVRLPYDEATAANTFGGGERSVVLYLSPLWLRQVGGEYRREMLNPGAVTIASVTARVDAPAMAVVTRSGVSLEDVKARLPEDVASRAPGMYVYGGYHVAVHPHVVANPTTADALVVTAASRPRLVAALNELPFEASDEGTWYNTTNEAANRVFRAMEVWGQGAQQTYLLGWESLNKHFAKLPAEGSEVVPWGKERITVTKVEVGGKPRFSVLHTDHYYTIQTDLTGRPVAVYENVRERSYRPVADLQASPVFQARYATLTAAVNGAAIGAVLVIQGGSAVLAFQDGDWVKASTYAAAAGGLVWGLVHGETPLLDLTKRASVKNVLKALKLRDVSATNSAIAAAGALVAGHEFAAAATESDSIRRQEHVESAFATILDTAIFVGLGEVSGPVILGWQLYLVSAHALGGNPRVLEITGSPGSAIIFIMTYFFTTDIPAATAEAAYGAAADFAMETARTLNAWGQPAVVVFPA